jgi:hypothetical protein
MKLTAQGPFSGATRAAAGEPHAPARLPPNYVSRQIKIWADLQLTGIQRDIKI